MKKAFLVMAAATMFSVGVWAQDVTTSEQPSEPMMSTEENMNSEEGFFDVETYGHEIMRPGRPGRPGRHRVVCYAQNRRGQYFQAVGRFPQMVQRQAMNRCFQVSRQCRPLGCRWF